MGACRMSESSNVVEANPLLTSKPETVNSDSHGAGWLYLVQLSNPAEIDSLLTSEQYAELVK